MGEGGGGVAGQERGGEVRKIRLWLWGDSVMEDRVVTTGLGTVVECGFDLAHALTTMPSRVGHISTISRTTRCFLFPSTF